MRPKNNVLDNIELRIDTMSLDGIQRYLGCSDPHRFDTVVRGQQADHVQCGSTADANHVASILLQRANLLLEITALLRSIARN